MAKGYYYNIGYRYGEDNKIEYMRTNSPLIPHKYDYIYHSNVLPKNTTNWYRSRTSTSGIDWISGKEYVPIREHEVPSDIRAMNLLLLGE